MPRRSFGPSISCPASPVNPVVHKSNRDASRGLSNGYFNPNHPAFTVESVPQIHRPEINRKWRHRGAISGEHKFESSDRFSPSSTNGWRSCLNCRLLPTNHQRLSLRQLLLLFTWLSQAMCMDVRRAVEDAVTVSAVTRKSM